MDQHPCVELRSTDEDLPAYPVVGQGMNYVVKELTQLPNAEGPSNADRALSERNGSSAMLTATRSASTPRTCPAMMPPFGSGRWERSIGSAARRATLGDGACAPVTGSRTDHPVHAQTVPSTGIAPPGAQSD